MPKVNIIDWTKVAEGEIRALYSNNEEPSPSAG